MCADVSKPSTTATIARHLTIIRLLGAGLFILGGLLLAALDSNSSLRQTTDPNQQVMSTLTPGGTLTWRGVSVHYVQELHSGATAEDIGKLCPNFVPDLDTVDQTLIPNTTVLGLVYGATADPNYDCVSERHAYKYGAEFHVLVASIDDESGAAQFVITQDQPGHNSRRTAPRLRSASASAY